MKNADVAILIVAGGRGARAGAGLPKQYRRLAGRPVLARTLEVFAQALPQTRVQVVIHPDDEELYAHSLAQAPPGIKILPPAMGGANRQASVLRGLEAIRIACMDAKFVIIHD